MTITEEVKEFTVDLTAGQIAKPSKWDREYVAFLDMLPDLLHTHRDQFVAVHQGQLVEAGPDRVTVALDFYRRFGMQEVLVQQVTVVPPPVIRIPTVFRHGMPEVRA